MADSPLIQDCIACALALGDTESEEYWKLVGQLHHLATTEVFEAAAALCQAASPSERELGAHVLGQLGPPERPFQPLAVPLLLDLLNDPDQRVVEAAVSGLGHHRDARAIAPLAKLREHPDANLRWHVAVSLLTHDDPAALAALIELSQDVDAHVRDWATFGLGTQTDVDTPAIREALVARLRDPDGDTRAEALAGLAKRKDERVVEALIEALTSEAVGTLDIESAGELGDARLVPALRRLLGTWPEQHASIEAAIVACQSFRSRR